MLEVGKWATGDDGRSKYQLIPQTADGGYLVSGKEAADARVEELSGSARTSRCQVVLPVGWQMAYGVDGREGGIVPGEELRKGRLSEGVSCERMWVNDDLDLIIELMMACPGEMVLWLGENNHLDEVVRLGV